MHLTIDAVRFDDPVHLRWWYEIRNAESTRNGCRSRKKITVDEHYIWWHESKFSKTRRLFFIRKHEGVFQPQVIGIARLDLRKGWTELSLALSPEWRGHGFGRRAVAGLLDLTHKLKWPTPGAVVNGKNGPSLSVFLKSGFVMKRSGFVQLTKSTGKR